jgi:hypothetical protein
MSYTCLQCSLLESREFHDAAAQEEKNSFLPRLYAVVGKDEQSKIKELLIIWYQVIRDYTLRTLTFQRDKLVVIAGMAQIIKDFMNDEYFAGLWMRNLPQALLWSPYEEETFPNAPRNASLPSSYRAPSWPWAAVESPISNFLCRQTLGSKTHAEVLNIETTLQGPDSYGQVKSGYLNIKAPFLKAIVGTQSGPWPYQPNIVPLNYQFTERALADELEEESKLGHTIFNLEWPEKGSRIWLLQVTDLYGLILLPVTSNDSDAFRRIGVCHFASNVKIKTTSSIKII